MSDAIIMHHTSVSSMDNNCYLLECNDKGLLVDAAAEPETLLALAADNNVTITTVVTTHQHWDHVRALREVLDATGAMHITSRLDAPGIDARIDYKLDHGDTIEFEGHSFPVFVLRGHTAGGLGFAVEIDGATHLFVGDSLFPGGVGKTESPEDFTQLLSDVEQRVFDVYPDDAIVHPGHGDNTTLGAERPHLPKWRERGW